MKSTNQKGFSAIEGILLVVIVGLLAGLGYYVMRQNSDSNSSMSDQSIKDNPDLSSQKVGTIEGIEAVADASAADDASIASELEQDSYNNALADAEALETVGDAINESNL